MRRAVQPQFPREIVLALRKRKSAVPLLRRNRSRRRFREPLLRHLPRRWRSAGREALRNHRRALRPTASFEIGTETLNPPTNPAARFATHRAVASDTPISEKLRLALAASDLSDYEIAKRARVSQTVVSRFVRRQRDITLATADRLCAALGLGLVEWDDPPGARLVDPPRPIAATSPILDDAAPPQRTPARRHAPKPANPKRS